MSRHELSVSRRTLPESWYTPYRSTLLPPGCVPVRFSDPGFNTTWQSLFQCLYAQCDGPDYGPALLHSMHTCIASGAEIHMEASNSADPELLRAREVEYLAGRELPEVPGLQLRQDSAGGQGFGPTTTTTAWVTTTGTVTAAGNTSPMGVTPFPGASGQAGNTPGNGNGGVGPILTITNLVTVTTTVNSGGLLPAFSMPELGSSHDAGGGPIITPFVGPNASSAAPTRPWMVTASETAERHRPSYVGLMLWASAMLALDIYVNASWGYT
ncbi:hypothetical protein JX265_001618 [Neoarthrinium moseri]|uniref:Uncharacterized protein n=1 Tax=Neoarthrinium moseri TaxID=1658444 RepID=A0A9P9WVR2_9PEZI|nr:hypothetical protein JX265_001618 [Neoarthrinium moseri]